MHELTRYCLLFGFFWISAANDDCRKENMCNECVISSSHCSWCTDQGFRGEHRCDSKENLKKENCPDRSIYSPKVEVKIDRNLEFGKVLPGSFVVNQLKPQGVQVKVKPGESATYQLEYAHSGGPSDIKVVHSTRDQNIVKLDYKLDCHGRWINSNQCQQVKDGEHVKINASITVNPSACKAGNKKGTIAAGVSVSGYRQMSGLWIHPICDCECSKLQQQEINSRRCSLHGNMVCGQCACHDQWLGKYCRCPIRTGQTKESIMDQCKNKDGVICSNNGECDCGRCRCKDRQHTGQFCECDNTACPKNNNRLCGGNGDCRCGKCHCRDGWTGPACACTTNEAACRSSNGGVCNGHGTCICGRCKCENPYSGTTCEIGPTPPTTTRETTPQPTQPQPEPTQPQPEPTEPQPEPTEPKPEPTEPKPEPTEPKPEPTQPQPEPTQPQPEPTQPPTEPTEPEPEPTEPKPEPTEPEPEPTQTDPEVTEPPPEATGPAEAPESKPEPEGGGDEDGKETTGGGKASGEESGGNNPGGSGGDDGKEAEGNKGGDGDGPAAESGSQTDIGNRAPSGFRLQEPLLTGIPILVLMFSIVLPML